ncbi:hypothetical protein GLOIN_2v1773514 [Rhizophagus clarus]|uniref:Uncharacterized protein n=1 Tax=Rhizophagus clarus TaxID=94130 RepID=A0A8H3QG26_9GLOM|nr:hypothetical protein GLOIN_2v1773514 [Rhizophagus clarus]
MKNESIGKVLKLIVESYPNLAYLNISTLCSSFAEIDIGLTAIANSCHKLKCLNIFKHTDFSETSICNYPNLEECSNISKEAVDQPISPFKLIIPLSRTPKLSEIEKVLYLTTAILFMEETTNSKCFDFKNLEENPVVKIRSFNIKSPPNDVAEKLVKMEQQCLDFIAKSPSFKTFRVEIIPISQGNY